MTTPGAGGASVAAQPPERLRGYLEVGLASKMDVLRAELPLGVPVDPVLAGSASFAVSQRGESLVITDARRRDATVIATDVFATNGVIHAIDRVILPPAH